MGKPGVMAVVLVAYLRQRFHLSPERTAGDLAVQGVTVVWVSYDCAQPAGSSTGATSCATDS